LGRKKREKEGKIKGKEVQRNKGVEGRKEDRVTQLDFVSYRAGVGHWKCWNW